MCTNVRMISMLVPCGLCMHDPYACMMHVWTCVSVCMYDMCVHVCEILLMFMYVDKDRTAVCMYKLVLHA